MFKIHTYFP